MKAIEAIKTLNIRRLYDVVVEEDISMCGPGPTMTAMEYARLLGAKNVSLLKYATSGDVTGDRGSVVGYASIAFFK